MDRLSDAAATDLADLPGPLVGVDASWAFQWDFELPSGQSMLISKDKSVRPSPEPSSIVLCLIGLLGGFLLMAAKRR